VTNFNPTAFEVLAVFVVGLDRLLARHEFDRSKLIWF